MENVEATFKHVPTDKLPQVSNALYHMTGYFKKCDFQVTYLLQSRFWSHDRNTPFNLVPISLADDNNTYQASGLPWHGDYLTLK